MILPPGIATGILSAPKGVPNFEDLAVSLKRYPDTNLRDLTARGLKAIMRCEKFICRYEKYVDKKTTCRREKPLLTRKSTFPLRGAS
jgi:hypothetical protein